MGFALSKEAIPLLQRLQQAGWLGEIRWPDDPISPADWLAREWPLASAVVAVAASGLVTRLVAPLLVSKATDPARPAVAKCPLNWPQPRGPRAS